MAKGNYVFTSESVSEGHPDKVCDRISDAIVDTYLTSDPHARVAVETLCTTNRIVIAGEVRGPDSITRQVIEDVARQAVRDIGYEQDGFHWKHADVQIYVHRQSADIAQGADAAYPRLVEVAARVLHVDDPDERGARPEAARLQGRKRGQPRARR